MSVDDRPREPSEEAQETFARYLLSARQGPYEDPERGFEQLLAGHPELAAELRLLEARWRGSGRERSLRERLHDQRGVDLDPQISLEPRPVNEAPSEARGEDAPGADEGSGSSSRVLARLRRELPATGRYTLRGELARGGMGAILQVWDEDLRRSLAMKVVLGRGEDELEVDDAKLARFLEEAQITGQLDHPGVVPVHEIGIGADGRVFFTMQLVKGRDLRQVYELVRDGSEGWNLTRALGVILRVCEAMAFAHEKHVVHRDLKPANVMVGRFGETYVMDWGLAKVLGREDSRDVRIRPPGGPSLSVVQTDRGDSSRSQNSPLQTMDGDVVGTPCYMAPEQARGALDEIGPQSDVYSVGALLYELLAGRAPYTDANATPSPIEVLGKVIHGPPRPIGSGERGGSRVPGELIAICDKAMARRPADRYASMMAMAEDLRAYLENRVVGAYEAGAVAEFRKWVGRNRGMAAGVAAAVLAVVAGLAGVAAVQSNANLELTRANDQLSSARDQLADSNADLGRAVDDLSAASRLASEKEREARRSSYSANLAAAAASLEAGAIEEARRRLELCADELRGWEWDRLWLEADSSSWSVDLERELRTISPFLDLAATPDGELALVATAWDDTLVLDPARGEVVRTLALGASAQNLGFAPGGRLLVTTGIGRDLRVVDLGPGGLLEGTPTPLLEVPRAHRSVVSVLEVSPDGSRILTAGLDKHVRLRELATGDELWTIDLGTSPLCAAWSPDGSRFATGAQDRTVRIHDGASGEVLRALEGHALPVVALAFDPRGRFVASGTQDLSVMASDSGVTRRGRVRVADVESGVDVLELDHRTSGVTSLTFLPAGDRLAVTARDGTVLVCELATGEVRTLRGHEGAPIHAALTGGDLLATAGTDWTLRGFDLEGATGVDLSPHPREVLELTPLEGAELASLSSDGILRIHDTRSGLVLHDFREHPPSASALAYAPGSGRLASLGASLGTLGMPSAGQLLLYDAGTRAELARIELGRPASDVAITPDGALIAVALHGAQVVLLDGRTGRELDRLDTEFSLDTLALHPRGRLLAGAEGSGGRGSGLWDLETGERLPLGESRCRRVRFLSDGELIGTAVGDAVWLRRTDDQTELAVFRGHAGTVTDLGLSPDGSRLATACEDGKLRLFDAATGELLLALDEQGGPGASLAFLPDGRLALGLSNGRLRVLDRRADPELRAAHRAGRRTLAAAHEVLAPLFEELVQPAEVARRLRADDALDPEVREAALALAARVPCTAQQLEEECREVVRSPFAPDGALLEVSWKARLAATRDPDDEAATGLLGMALFRLGSHQQALVALERADRLRIETRRARPEVAAFLALAHERLGHREQAEAQLERLRGLMSISALQTSRDAVALLAEAERAVGD